MLSRFAAVGLIAIAGLAGADGLATWSPRCAGSFPTDFAAIGGSPAGTRLLAVGSDGGAAWSHDGGTTWSFVALGTPADATGVAWQDENRVWVSGTLPAGWGGTGTLLGSADGGRTWATVVADHPVPLTSVAFADTSHGFAGQPADGVLATDDGGVTWVPIDHPGIGLAAIEFVDELLGVAAGTGFDFDLKRTLDGGASWTLAYQCPDGTITAVSFPNPHIGYLASPVSVAWSADAGASWSPRASLTETWIDDLVFADADTGWLGGTRQLGNDRRGLVLATVDGGQHWTDTGLDEADRVAALALAGSGALLAAGGGGTLLRSDDGGASWTDLAATPADHFRDLLMESPTAGWAVGPVGAVHHTADGGASWTTTGGLGTWTLESIVRAAPSTLYACGSYAFAASEDNGTSWQMRYTYLDCHVLRFTDALNGLAGTRYGVFWTDDGGLTWTMADNGGIGTGGVFDLAFLDASHGFAAAGIGTILETVDGGRSWNVVHSEPPGFNSYLYGIAFANAATGFAVGMDGVIFKTTNGGASWSPLTSGVTSHLFDVHPFSAIEALAVGRDGTALFTTNGGGSWTPADSGTTADLWAIEVAGTTPLIAGDWGTILEPGLANLIFADGFESGGTTSWSAAVP